MQQLLEERMVHVHEAQLPEGGKEETALYFLDLRKAGHVPAHDVISHQRDAVIGAASAVVEVPLPAQIGAPVGEKILVLYLNARPDGFPLVRGIMQRDFRLNLPLAGLGVEDVAASVEL